MASPWLKFFPTDWRSDPKLRMCSVAARGLWIEMLCLMHEAEPYGSLVNNGQPLTIRQLWLLCGISSERETEKLLAELEKYGVFSRDEDGTIYSRRMRRDCAKAEYDKANGRKGGSPEIRTGTVPKEQRVRPYRRSDSPAKTLRIWEKSGGKCHWCGGSLLWEGTGEEPNLFQVDHVKAVCDGGTNAEKNLVAACSDCNHKRARQREPTVTPVTVGNSLAIKTDSNPQSQKPESRNQIPENQHNIPDSGLRASAPQSLISPEAHTLAEEIWKSAGFSKETLPPGWCGAAMAIQKWLSDDCPGEVIKLAVTTALSRRKRDGPPNNFTYFAGPIAQAFADYQRPNPTAQPQAFERNSNGHCPPKRTVIDAADGIIADLDRRIAAAEAQKTGDGTGQDFARLLPPGRRD